MKRAGSETALPSSPLLLLLLSADSDFEFHSNAADAIEMLFRFYTPNRFKPALLAGRRILKNLLGMDQLAMLQMGMDVEQFGRHIFYKYAIKFSHLGRAHPPPHCTALSPAGFILHTLIRLFRIQNEAPIDTSSPCLHLCGTR